jgi:predicted Zn-dependent protease
VFAPLAEAYRKLGMTDEALKVLKEGIKRHPSYVLGYLVLAQCYHDQKKNDAAYQTLQPLTPHNRDNPGLQKLFAQVCLELGNLDEALETFKYLLFLNPSDKYSATQVRVLEDDLQKKQPALPQSTIVKAPPAASSQFGIDEDDWAMVDFAPDVKAETSNSIEEDQWSMSSPTSAPVAAPARDEDWKVMSRSIDDEFFSDDEVTPEDADAPLPEDSAPVASHTLVDLYVAQKHIGPAIDLLENIVSLNPNDRRSVLRLAELRQQVATTDDDGEEELLRIIETEVQGPHAVKMERALKLFLQQVQLTAMEKQDSRV